MLRAICRQILVAVVVFMCALPAVQAENTFLKALASPKGVMVVSVVYCASQAISNFIWAFNWAKHTDMDPDTAVTLQEWGGLTASMESFLLGVVVPIMVWEYTQNQAAVSVSS